jgi:adenine phosphoribosyltransferase
MTGAGERDVAALIDSLTRTQQDFPLPGVLFRDITALLAHPEGLRTVAAALVEGFEFDLIAGLEARGFLLAGAAAVLAGTGLVAVRKPGKLPGAVLGEDYSLEYGTARLEVHPDDIPDGARVLIVDDVLATGGTAGAACRLVEAAGGVVAGVSVIIELDALGGRATLPGRDLRVLRHY